MQQPVSEQGADTPFEAHLRAHQNDRFKILCPDGNHGDRLIREGRDLVFDRNGIDYDIEHLGGVFEPRHASIGGHAEFVVRRTVETIQSRFGQRWYDRVGLDGYDHVMIDGGGNMNDLWVHGGSALRSLCKISDIPITVGPQTYFFSRSDLTSMLSLATVPITLFCREQYSVGHIERFDLPPAVTIEQSPDTALYLSSDDLDDVVAPTPDDYTLLAFREDFEGVVTDGAQKAIHESVSNPLAMDASRADSYAQFVSLVRDAECIYTDRLHVGVLAAILGVETILFENSYYKTRGVYKYSLNDMDWIEFRDATDWRGLV